MQRPERSTSDRLFHKPGRMNMERSAELQLRLPAALETLPEASARLVAFLEQAEADEAAIYALETALEELLTNVIKYAHIDPRGREILVVARSEGRRVELWIEDDGRPFDPTRVAVPDMTRTIEEMPIGGLGIHLVRSLTTGMEYARVNNRNRLRIWVDPPGETRPGECV